MSARAARASTATSDAPAPHTTEAVPGALSAPGAATMRAAIARRVAGWRYEGGKRDVRLDFLRGFAVFAMVVDHLGGEPSWLFTLTGGNRFLFSAAEGFVFISGFVMGIVYCGVIAKAGLRAAITKAVRRAGSLYLLTVLLSLGFISLSYLLRLPWVEGVQVTDPLARLIERLTLRRAFYLTDVLLMYTLLVGVAPVAFLLLAKRRTPFLLLGSWTLWALFQQWPEQVVVPWRIEDNSVFQFAAWQALFFTALALGYHRDRVAAWTRRLPTAPLLAALALLFAASVVFYNWSAAILTRLAPDADPDALMQQFFSKPDVRIGRIAVFAVFFPLALLLVTQLWRPLVAALGWFLLPLGQSALLAYSTHLFVLAFFTRLVPLIPGFRNTSAPVNTVTQLAGVGLVYVIVRLTPAIKRLAADVRQTVVALVAPSQQTLVAPQAPRVIARRGR